MLGCHYFTTGLRLPY